jgi:hypothetical protein
MIIISSLACVISLIIIFNSLKTGIFNLNRRKILVYEEEIITVNKEKEEISEELLLAASELKIAYNEKIDSPHTIKVLENTYEEKTLNEKKILEKKYGIQLEKTQKIIIKNTIENMFKEDIKNVFNDYSCNVASLEKELEIFFKNEK